MLGTFKNIGWIGFNIRILKNTYEKKFLEESSVDKSKCVGIDTQNLAHNFSLILIYTTVLRSCTTKVSLKFIIKTSQNQTPSVTNYITIDETPCYYQGTI